MRLSTVERKILNCVQKELPLTPEPFKILSKRIGLTEGELFERIKRLKNKGLIRNFSASVDHKVLGYTSSLIALRVPVESLRSIVKKVIGYPEITHCFLREGEYNLWVVFICLKKKKLTAFLNELAKQIGRGNILNLPTKQRFKLKTAIKL